MKQMVERGVILVPESGLSIRLGEDLGVDFVTDSGLIVPAIR
jgi:hypothetical protein